MLPVNVSLLLSVVTKYVPVTLSNLTLTCTLLALLLPSTAEALAATPSVVDKEPSISTSGALK